MANASSPPPPPKHMEQIEQVFNRFDANGDGKISVEELGDVLAALGSSNSPDELARIMAELDSDGDGFVDRQEFVEFQRGGAGSEEQAIQDLNEAFDMYDLDHDGLISAAELHQVLRRLGDHCSLEDCARMIKSVDSDGDGSVDFQEFVKMMSDASLHTDN